MGKLKDRDNENQKKDTRLSFRTSSVLLDELKQKTGKTDMSKAIQEAINEYLKFKRNPETDYACYECNKKILTQEQYYCNIDQLEIRTPEEIIPLKGEPTKILCLKCANKHAQIKKFIQTELDQEGTQVQTNERKI